METTTLADFIGVHRDDLLHRCRAKVAERSAGLPVEPEMRGIPRFLDDLVSELRSGPSRIRVMGATATLHGADLFNNGRTIGQVVHDYGAVCQSITDLAVELDASINSNDFRTLDRCLDDGIAFAVAEYSHQKQLGMTDDARIQSIRLVNLVETAIAGFDALQSGAVGIAGTTGALVHRSLLELRASLGTPTS